MKFVKKSGKVVLFKAAENIAYRKENWSGTVSFWLKLDPNKDLGDWYCDPIQITEKTWNDGALWVDFSKDDKPKHFRLGAFADLKVWNPANKDFEKMAAAERPMHTVTKPPFMRDRWTHVAFAFENFNTGKADGAAKLYLDGKLQGAITGRNQRFTWDVEKAAIQLGMSYVGLFDDLALFDRRRRRRGDRGTACIRRPLGRHEVTRRVTRPFRWHARRRGVPPPSSAHSVPPE
ncbi:MAG: LamG-like jellyroll fold domain-containing protein [Gemmataceae bacterium]